LHGCGSAAGRLEEGVVLDLEEQSEAFSENAFAFSSFLRWQ
jgi:hypothetical protein